jgi:hypothetical protein
VLTLFNLPSSAHWLPSIFKLVLPCRSSKKFLQNILHSLTSWKALFNHSHCCYNLIVTYLETVQTHLEIWILQWLFLCMLAEVFSVYIMCGNDMLSVISITKTNGHKSYFEHCSKWLQIKVNVERLVIFEVLKMVTVRITVFWGKVLCSLVNDTNSEECACSIFRVRFFIFLCTRSIPHVYHNSKSQIIK